MSLIKTGYLTIEEIKASVKYPTEERFKKGPVAVIECVQEIPCNPCEAACKFGAIKIGNPITNLPELNEDTCTGCGVCVAQCPGLSIFIIDKTYSDNMATISFPHEYIPLPQKGLRVEAVNRSGQVVCTGEVIRIMNPKSFDRTPVITLAVPKDKAEEVRGMKRL